MGRVRIWGFWLKVRSPEIVKALVEEQMSGVGKLADWMPE